jgi:hypothetical protein
LSRESGLAQRTGDSTSSYKRRDFLIKEEIVEKFPHDLLKLGKIFPVSGENLNYYRFSLTLKHKAVS